HIDALFQEHYKLTPRTSGPIDASQRGLPGTLSQKSHTSRYINVRAPGRPLRKTNRRAINFRDPGFETEPCQAHRISSERICFDDARTGGDVLLVDRPNPIGLGDTHFLKTTLQRNSGVEKQCPDGPVTG